MRRPRILAILAAHNEERFIGSCLTHLISHGVECYLIDNGSTDETVGIAERYLHRGVRGIEEMARGPTYDWYSILRRKEELAATLEADWFIHVDPDEVRLPPRPGITLAEALAEVSSAGFNAVNFNEFTFTPTQESPDHDHPDYMHTMRWYYPFFTQRIHQLKAWSHQSTRVALAPSGGHLVTFPGLRVYPTPFPMKHYLFLSVPHAVRKYVDRVYDPFEVAKGWHVGRAVLRKEDIILPGQHELRTFRSNRELDISNPRWQHFLFDEAWRGARLGTATQTSVLRVPGQIH